MTFFDDFQKAFDIGDHNIFLKQLDHIDISGISNQWFICYV